MNGMYEVTAVSPMGTRETFNVEGPTSFQAREKIVQLLLLQRPGWRALNARLLYRVA